MRLEVIRPRRVRGSATLRRRDIEIIGERDGITYGRWRGGPAGTLNIEFDWRFGRNFDPETRARMERAGKSWSWRMVDDYGTYELKQGREIAGGLRVLDGDVVADDIVIFVIDKGDTSSSSGGPNAYRYTADDDHWQTVAGYVWLSRRHGDLTGVMAHEIGHSFVWVRGSRRERYVNTVDGTFEGPEAMRVNGGQPVSYQWVDENNRPVPPHTPGATVQYTHLGVCTSIMAYCSDPREIYRPSELDFAYLKDAGYEILDADAASEPELYGYGAWGRYSAWGAGVERTIDYESGRVRRGDRYATGKRRRVRYGTGHGPGRGASGLARGSAGVCLLVGLCDRRRSRAGHAAARLRRRGASSRSVDPPGRRHVRRLDGARRRHVQRFSRSPVGVRHQSCRRERLLGWTKAGFSADSTDPRTRRWPACWTTARPTRTSSPALAEGAEKRSSWCLRGAFEAAAAEPERR